MRMKTHWQDLIEVNRMKRERDFCMERPHAHERYEIYYVLSGQCKMFAGHELFILGPGDMMLLPPGCLHRTNYGDAEVTERWSILFDESVLEDLKAAAGEDYLNPLWEKMYIPLVISERGRLEEFFFAMDELNSRKEEVYQFLARNRLLEILVLAKRNLESRQAMNGERKEKAGEEASGLMRQAARYICSHYDQPLTLEQLAGQVHMTPTYFSRKFKEITGFRLKEYITYVRILEAEKLLMDTDQPITEIAMQCGFSDGNYFGDVFARIKGSSPREYRKKHFRKGI